MNLMEWVTNQLLAKLTGSGKSHKCHTWLSTPPGRNSAQRLSNHTSESGGRLSGTQVHLKDE